MTRPSHHWLVGDQRAVAAERILDAAGRCFARDGVGATSIGAIAREAGCSRPTIYRYFDDREALRTAFVHREARRLGSEIAAELRSVRSPRRRLVAAVLAAVRGVRANPLLAAWFTGADAVATADVAGSSPVIEAMAVGLLDDGDREAARWLVRVVLSLLTMPGEDDAAERRMLERFVAPMVVPASPASRRS